MSSAELIALVILATVGTFTPGPNNTLAATLGANYGLRRALPFVCAVPVGWGVLLVANVAGLGIMVLSFPPLRWGLLTAGVLYLLWLASKLVRARQLSEHSSSPIVGFRQGVLLQFINIKAWLLAMSVASGWVVGHDNTLVRLVEALPIFLLFGFTSNFTYAWVGARLQHWLRGPDNSERRLIGFNRFMAAALVATAGWLVLSAN
jgi:threonine/homoserine/homoserine lactone efflux protein